MTIIVLRTVSLTHPFSVTYSDTVLSPESFQETWCGPGLFPAGVTGDPPSKFQKYNTGGLLWVDVATIGVFPSLHTSTAISKSGVVGATNVTGKQIGGPSPQLFLANTHTSPPIGPSHLIVMVPVLSSCILTPDPDTVQI